MHIGKKALSLLLCFMLTASALVLGFPVTTYAAGVSAYDWISAITFDSKTGALGKSGNFVNNTFTDQGSGSGYVMYNGVDFGSNTANEFHINLDYPSAANYPNNNGPRTVDIYIDGTNTTGTKVGSVTVTPQGDWEVFTEFTAMLTTPIAGGTHDVCIYFVSTNGAAGNFKDFKFSYDTSASTGVSAYDWISAIIFDSKTGALGIGGNFVNNTFTDQGSGSGYVMYNDIDFGEETADQFHINLDYPSTYPNNNGPRTVEIYIDGTNTTGTKVGSVTVTPQGDWEQFTEFTAMLTTPINGGTHDVCLYFVSTNGAAGNFKDFKFSYDTSASVGVDAYEWIPSVPYETRNGLSQSGSIINQVFLNAGYVLYKDINFSNKTATNVHIKINYPSTFSFNVAAGPAKVEIFIDGNNSTGTKVGEIIVSPSGDWDQFVELSEELTASIPDGLHDVCLYFEGKGNSASANFQAFKFSYGGDNTPTVASVSVSPGVVNVKKGATRSFSASVIGSNSPSQSVTWTVEGGIPGTTITSGGALTIAAAETAATLTVRATSVTDTTKSGTATVTVLASGASAYDEIPAVDFDEKGGSVSQGSELGLNYLSTIFQGGYARYNNINFDNNPSGETGANKIHLSIAYPYNTPREISVYIDGTNTTGTLIAKVPVTGTDSWYDYTEFTAMLETPIASGVHDVYIRFPSNSSPGNLLYLTFSYGEPDDPNKPKPPVPATGITLNKTSASLAVGDIQVLTANVTPVNATDRTVAWTSDAEAIATVDEDGLVTAHAVGTATITATANGGENVKTTCTVTVTEPTPTLLTAYYVATDGSDSNPGTEAQPFLTVQKARDTIRLVTAGGMTDDITVYLREGTYYLSSTLQFNESDSGRGGYTITYTSYPGEQAEINGGKRVLNWEPHAGNIYKANVGDVKFNSLFENGERSWQARFPNLNPDGTDGYLNSSNNSTRTRVNFTAGAIPAVTNTANLQAFLDMEWYAGMYNLTGIDYGNNYLTLKGSVPYSDSIFRNTRFYIQGAYEFLDQPGEFYLDRVAQILYYWPRGADIENLTIDAPLVTRIIEVKGSAPDTPVHNLVFSGLTIRNADMMDDYHWQDNVAGYVATQGSGVWIENARNVIFENSSIGNIGMNGIRMFNYSQENEIKNSRVYDFGGCGIYIEGPHVFSGKLSTNLTKNPINKSNLIYGNKISDGGMFNIYDGYGVIVAGSAENLISNNRVSDIARGGIQLNNWWERSLGMVAADGVTININNVMQYAHSRDNVVEFNDVYNAVAKAADAAALYAYYVGLGNVFNNNWVHGIAHNAHETSSMVLGIYLDNHASGVTVSNNIISQLNEANRNATMYGMLTSQINEGNIPFDSNTIQNNFVVDSNLTSGWWSRGNGVLHTIEHNIIAANMGAVYRFDSGTANTIYGYADYNLFHSPTGQYRITGVSGVPDMNAWKTYSNSKYDQNSVIAEPGFIDWSGLDYRLAYDSPALPVGIQNVNVKDIGLTLDYPFSDESDPLANVYAYTDTSGNNPWDEISLGGSVQLNLLGRSVKGYAVDLLDADVSYSSDNTAAATVNSTGLVQSAGNGVARITITVTKGGTTKTTYFDIISGLDYAATDEMVEGQELDIKTHVEVGLADFYNPATSSVAYSSDNTGVATVSTNGIVTAVSSGVVNILAAVTEGGSTKYVTVQITVLENILSEVIVTCDTKLCIGDSGQLQVKGILTDGSEADLSGATITYSSSAASIADVDNYGMLTVKDFDKAVITVTVTLNGVVKTGTFTVNIRDAFTTILATTLDEMGAPVSSNGTHLVDTAAGGWAQFNDVYFGAEGEFEATKFFVNNAVVGSQWVGGRIEIRLGSPTGTLIGTLVAKESPSWTTYLYQEIEITPTSGIHDVYLVFPDKEGGSTGNLRSIGFIGQAIVPTTYTISGKVTGSDAPSGLAATVQLKSGGSNVGSPVTAAADGTYTISGVEAGTYTIEVSMSGYDTGTITSFAVSAITTGKDITLQKTAPARKKGDVNWDGKIDFNDVLAIQNYVYGLADLTGDNFWAADINDDGQINFLDLLAVQNHVYGLVAIPGWE